MCCTGNGVSCLKYCKWLNVTQTFTSKLRALHAVESLNMLEYLQVASQVATLGPAKCATSLVGMDCRLKVMYRHYICYYVIKDVCTSCQALGAD